jgi:hypothetical protein
MNLQRATTVALVALCAAACAGEGSWTGAMSDSAGVTIVSNTDRGIWTESSQWTLEEELRIGEVEGDPNYQFGQIGMIGVASDGRMFVLDQQAQHVQVFDADGHYIRTLGGPGAGPGELSQAAGFCLVAAGDTLWIPDLMTQRINRWAPAGELLPSLPLAVGQMLPAVFRATAAGEIVYQVRPLPLPNAPAPDSMDTILLMGPEGGPSDTLMRFPTGEGYSVRGGAPEFNVWYPEPAWDVTEGLQVIYGVSDVYRFGVYAAGGTPERIVTMPFEQTPVSEREKQVILDFLEQLARDQGAPPERVQMFLAMVNFGEFIPAFSAILSGPRGTVWVQHIQSVADLTEEEMADFNIQDLGAPDWDVFDADGRYLGVVSMPQRFSPRGLREDKVYGVWRDELDVQYVTRLRIVGIPDAEG